MNSKLRVLWDGGAFKESHGGVSRYYCELMSRFGDGVECVLPVKRTVNWYLQERGVPAMDASVHDFVRQFCRGWYMPGVSYVYRLFALLGLVKCDERDNERELDAAIAKGEFDVYHVTAPNYYDRRWKKVLGKNPIVVTVHDLIFDTIRNDRRVMNGRRELFAAASAIIAVSKFTKSEIIRLYGVSSEKITVIYHGAGTFAPITDAKSVSDSYVLYVGRKDGYKNFAWMVKAIGPVLEAKGLKLVTTDGKYSDEELSRLYQGASAIVYPSRCEGFGIPLLEAMANGCPVLCSDIPVFHEVAGDAARYFLLDDEDDFRQKLLRTLNDSELVAKGYERIKSFSWDKCASETAEVYRKVVDAYRG